MATWPASLPQSHLLNLTVEDTDSVLRTPMDAGPPSRRNRFTAPLTTLSGPIIFTGDQYQTFLTFYRDTLNNGALSFDWTNPVDDATVSYAFKKPPKFTLIRGGTPSTRVWRGTIELEQQP